MKKRILGCLFLLAAVVSCKSAKPSFNETVTKTKTITETIHDTVFTIEKDSSYYRAYLDCKDGKVVVKEVAQSEPGRKLKSPKVRIEGNELKVDCEAEAEKKFAQWKSTYTTDVQYRTIEIPITTNILTWWQQTQIYGFRLLAFLGIVYFGWQFIKSKF